MGIKGTPNFDEPVLITTGMHKCRVSSVREEVGKQSGAPYLKWRLDFAGGRYLFYSTTWSGKGAVKFKDLVRATKFPDYESGEIDFDPLLGFFFISKF